MLLSQHKTKALLIGVIILSLLTVFGLTIAFVHALCGDSIWNIGEDIANCPQDANEYSISPPAQLNIPDALGNTVGMYIFPDWHKPTQPGLKTHWSSIMNATASDSPLQEQPKKPLSNYYDDTNPITTRWMIKWALEHGVNLFVYDWYDWSYTEQPIVKFTDQFDATKPDGGYYAQYKDKAKFALMWANHDTPISTVDILAKLDRAEVKFFRNPQYFKIDNQPVFMMFSMKGLIDNFGLTGANDLLTQMKDNMKAKGYNGLYIVFNGDCGSFPTQASIAFDAVTAYNYSNLMQKPIDTYDNYITKYRETWGSVYAGCQQRKNLTGQPISYFVPVSTGWDNTVWRGLYTIPMYISAIVGGTPDKFQTMLQNAKTFIAQKNIQPNVVMINAWNEWGEGSILEPRADKWGLGYLEAVKNIFTVAVGDVVPPAESTDFTAVASTDLKSDSNSNSTVSNMNIAASKTLSKIFLICFFIIMIVLAILMIRRF